MSKKMNNRAEPQMRLPLLRKLVQLVWIFIFVAFIYACFIDYQWLYSLLGKIVDATALPDHFIKMVFFFSMFLFACISFMFIVYSNGEGKVTDHTKVVSEHDNIVD